MKKLYGLIALSLLVFGCDSLRSRDMSSMPAKSVWLTDFSQAKAQASKENKLVLLDFTGSDWCPHCIELRKKVFNSDQFAKYAADNLVLLEVDFPEKKELPEAQQKANDALAEQFNVEGYPTVVVVDATGKVLMREVGYDGASARRYVKMLEKLKL